jgi:hypothetical protein
MIFCGLTSRRLQFENGRERGLCLPCVATESRENEFRVQYTHLFAGLEKEYSPLFLYYLYSYGILSTIYNRLSSSLLLP